MPKGKGKRKRHWYGRKGRDRKRKTVPLETVMALGAHGFVAPASGWIAPYDALTRGDFKHFATSELRGWTGIWIHDDGKTGFNAGSVLNPFDMGDAPYWKMVLWASLFGKMRKKLVPQTSKLFKKIPLIGGIVG